MVKKIFYSALFAVLILFNAEVFSQPLASGHSKFLGNVYGNGSPAANWDSYWNQVTPENSGKWGSVEPSRDNYSWSGLDQAYNYAKQRSLPFKMHNLIWGQQQPGWITSLDSASQAEEIEEWIRLVGERYPGLDFVDVVNEPLSNHAPAPYKNAMGGDGSTGWDWVIWAFEKARQYMPSAKLILNEYNILNSSSNTTTFLQIINLLKDRNLIDGIGVQGHRFEIESTDTSVLRSNLDKLAATGLPIYISEFDLGNIGNSGTANDTVQLQLYQRVFPVLWEHPGVKGITLWGYVQGQIWQTTTYLVRSDGSERLALKWLRTYLTVTDVEESNKSLPTQHNLLQNYPNPFNPSTTIRYSLRASSKVRLTVYSVLGVKVRTLVESIQNDGEHAVVWDATDDRNNPVPSGVYIYRLTTDDVSLQKKMLVLR
jgi:endo-1,4-beta-xylanase